MDQESTSQKLGSFLSSSMDALEEDVGDDAILGDMLIICEFQRQDEDGGSSTMTRYICSDERPHIAIGLIRLAQLASEQN